MSKIFFTDKGSGFPVVLIHGFCESHIIWDDLSNKLSPKYRILCPDLPGFGKSNPHKNPGFSLEDIADDLSAWLNDTGVQECIMIGHSLGGYVTLAFADKYMENLKGFGLFHSTCYADSEEKKETRNKVISFLETHSADEFTDTFVPGLFYNKSGEIKRDIERLVADARSCTKQSIISYTQAMRDRKERCHLLNNNIPVLFIAGENDSAVPLNMSRDQTKNLNKEFVHFLPETGHMGMFERKSETTEMISDFLDQIK